MVIYNNTKKGFIKDVDSGCLADNLKMLFKTQHIGSGDREYESWKNSSVFMRKIISDSRFDDDIDVYLEYVRHQTALDIFSLIETSELVPGKQLQDAITDMMQGIEMFRLIDEQKVVFEQVLDSVRDSLHNNKKAVNPQYLSYDAYPRS